MKKLRLSGKDIRRLGVDDNETISLIKNIFQKHYKHTPKKDVLEIISSIRANPGKYLQKEPLNRIAAHFKEEPTRKSSPSPHSPKLEAEKPFEVFGKEYIDPAALDQMHTAMQLPVSVCGAVMPDAHVGYGLPIGGVLAARNAVLPYGVGMDIGCRMAMSIYPMEARSIDRDRKKLRKLLITNTRFGRAEFDDRKEHPVLERREFQEIEFLRGLQKKAFDQLGTSGHGNHFVDIGILEIDHAQEGLGVSPGTYLTVLSHSGSRGLGAEVARHYTSLAQKRLDLPKIARPLAWLSLDSDEGQEYWQAMTLAGDYSAANHSEIHRRITKALGQQPLQRIENHHNFAWLHTTPSGEQWVVHRKGATPAQKGVLGIIPGSMASPAFIVRGKGCERSIDSAAHGAGRVMSRSQAKKTFTDKQVKKVLYDKRIELIGGGLDEAPMVYKDIRKVMELQEDVVEIVATFYPRIVRME